ncbi:MAG: hypothetical protein IGS03_14625 [Candidatus Sericytochromatia bacterium]|nr:hypothetical protein [Candidatus Sericytochromatia bacterium]
MSPENAGFRRLGTGFFSGRRRQRKQWQLSPAQLSALGFIALIILGTFLLALPWSTQGERSQSLGRHLLTTLFEATSAVCVTGLSVVNIKAHYSLFGQLILMLLIQIGGLGYMTLYSLMLLAVGRQLSLRDRLAMQKVLDLPGSGGVRAFILRILRMTLIIEAVGAVLLAFAWVPVHGLARGVYYAVFHSISAFNNAGFALFDDSLMADQTHPVVLPVIALLLILGGLGYPVLSELLKQMRQHPLQLHWQELSLHSKVSLGATGSLLLFGFISYLMLEFSRPGTLGSFSLGGKLLSAAFMSATTRTAGFNALNIAALSVPAIFITLSLMLVGANSGGTGGGVKTTTLVVILNKVWAILRGHHNPSLMKRRINPLTEDKAWATLLLSVLWINAITCWLTLTEPGADFLSVLFEVISAFATVGLSMGLTANLSTSGQSAIIVTMFVGRVGILTLGMALWARQQHKSLIKYAEESLMVG